MQQPLSIATFIAGYVDPGFDISSPLPFATSFRSIKKHQVLTRYGQREDHAYFLLSGIVKISMIREGEERILEFFFPGHFFSSYTSFLTRQVSDVEIEALSDCELEVIRWDDINKAYENSLLANKLGRVAAEFYYIKKTRREKDFLLKSAGERYAELIAGRPELVQQIPVHMIAKYLGIKPESLSRIRRELSL